MPAAGRSQPMGGASVNNQSAGLSQTNTYNNANYMFMPNYPQNTNVNVKCTKNMTAGQPVRTVIISSHEMIELGFLLV